MRVTKQSKYQKEREDICLKLIYILELDTDGCFLLNELDSNIEKQNKILDMKDEIQKYFAVSSITAFKPNVSSETKRPYLNIARAILRQEGYLFEGTTIWIKCETGKFTTGTKYKIFKKIIE
jgi:hypothetical protein